MKTTLDNNTHKRIYHKYANVSLSDFRFTLSGYGHYKVTYTSPVTGKTWTAITDNMHLIDLTKNSDNPKRKDLEALRYLVKTA
jgi:hypothetical protein